MDLEILDAARLRTLPFLLKDIAQRHGVQIKLSAAREIIAGMFGYQNWNLALRKTSDPAFENDQPSKKLSREEYHGQFFKVLVEKTTRELAEKIASDFLSAFSDDTHQGEFLESIFDEQWQVAGIEDIISSIAFDSGAAIYFRKIIGSDATLKGYRQIVDIQAAERKAGAVSIIYAFKHGDNYEPFGHVSYRQIVSNAGDHIIEVLSEHCERYVDNPIGDWSRKVMPHVIKVELQNGGYWLNHDIPEEGVPIIISPPLVEWRRPSAALSLLYSLTGLIEEEDEFGGPFGEEDDEVFERDHARFSDVSVKAIRSSASRTPTVGTKHCTAKLVELIKSVWSYMEFMTARQRYIRVDPVRRSVEPLEDVGGVLVCAIDRYDTPDTEYPGDRFARDLSEGLSSDLTTELYSLAPEPYLLICGFSVSAMISEVDFYKASWGRADGIVKRLTAKKEHPSQKQFGDMLMWATLLPDRLDQAFKNRKNLQIDPLFEGQTVPFSRQIKASWENEGIEHLLDEKELIHYEVEKKAVSLLGLSVGQVKNLVRQPGKFIIRPSELEFEGSDRLALMKQYDKQGAFFVVDVYDTPEELMAAIKLCSQSGLGDWDGFWQWQHREDEQEQDLTLATIRLSGSMEPQAVVSYFRDLDMQNDYRLWYNIKIDGIYVPEKYRGKGLGLAAAHIIVLDAFSDMEVLARQIKTVKAETGLDIIPDVNVSADADSKAEEIIYWRVANALEGGVRAFHQLDKMRGPFQGGRYVIPDIG